MGNSCQDNSSKMNKRLHNNNNNHDNHNNNNITSLTSHKMHLNRQKAEEMCQTKLRKISKVKSKLVQTVLVRNTLKYVQNCEHVSFSYDDGDDDIENNEYEPFSKKLCKDISIDDIDEILSEFDFSPECSEKERLKFNWNDTLIIRY
eukprot:TRINITY_DN8613_c0_g1_i1.p1 TRINITY_DN8613_c0_g1~~TRINITY_DN8613_c0_g1_i1.p1  ORF type:complete len:147 (-),score=33.02 TRINITY_DN8613_c0_g1_i1:246-686(-)